MTYPSMLLNTLPERVSSLEGRMGVAETELRTLSGLGSQVTELKQLLRQTLDHQQQRLDRLEAWIMDEVDSRNKLGGIIGGQERAFATLTKRIDRLPCLADDPEMPCPGDVA